MAITYSTLSNGDDFDALSLNTRFAEMETSINNLSTSDINDGTFTHHHLPSLVIESATAGLAPAAAGHTYREGTTDYPGWNTVSGWQVINVNGDSSPTTPELSASLSPAVDTADADFGGILVLMNVQVVDIYDNGGSGTTGIGVFAIQAKVGVTWHQIERTERYIRVGPPEKNSAGNSNDVQKEVSIRTLILGSDVGNGSISDIRGVCAVTEVPGGSSGTYYVKLRRCNISAIALQANVS